MEVYASRNQWTDNLCFGCLFACFLQVSEGMDFSDGRARCVVVTGIPYAPAMDAKVGVGQKAWLDIGHISPQSRHFDRGECSVFDWSYPGVFL